jgi:TetR/AcrR family transcriptional regulator, ethionamide resistance regulator
MSTDSHDERPGSRRAQRERERAPRRGDVREAAILEAAATLLAEGGEDAVTMAAIAKAVGVTRPTLYFYFDSKEAVMTELAAQTFADLMTFRDVDLSGLATSEAVMLWFERVADLWRAHAPVLLYVVHNAHRIPEIARLRDGALALAISGGKYLLERDRSQTGVDGTAMARAIALGAEASFCDLHSRPHTPEDERAVVRALTELNWGAPQRVGTSAHSRTSTPAS